LDFLDQFWFYKYLDVLNYFGKKIDGLSEPENDEYTRHYEKNDYAYGREHTLDFLTRFFRHQIKAFEPSFLLRLVFIRKKPEHLPEFIRRIRETLIFDEPDERYGFSRQHSFVRIILSKINEGQEHFIKAFFAIADTFLQHSFQITHGGRKNTITVYDYPIPESKEIESIRRLIWNTIFSLMNGHRKEVIDCVNNFSSNYRKGNPA